MSLPSMKVELQELEDERRTVEKQYEDANRQYKIGLWGVLLGIPLLLVWGLGLLFILAGGLAALTNSGKRSAAESRLDEIQARIAELRRQIAEAEAQ